MIRWFFLLATASLWWCTGANAPVDSMPEEATAEERESLKVALAKARQQALQEAFQRRLGPRMTDALTKSYQLKARDEAHDRHHARKLLEAKVRREVERDPIGAMMRMQEQAMSMENER